MAVTKIWAVKDSLQRVLDYAANPQKTALAGDGLAQALHYAGNDAKTRLAAADMDGEQVLLVTGLHCRAGHAWADMRAVQRRFGKTGGTVALHAYQSFRPRRGDAPASATTSEWNWRGGCGAAGSRCWSPPTRTPTACTTTLSSTRYPMWTAKSTSSAAASTPSCGRALGRDLPQSTGCRYWSSRAERRSGRFTRPSAGASPPATPRCGQRIRRAIRETQHRVGLCHRAAGAGLCLAA